MKKALVLGGGGAKGAYEIGAWKALRELDMHFDIVTGTSIGALIGAMVVQDDFVKAYDLWDHMEASQVIKDGISLDFDMELLMSQRGQLKQLLLSYVNHHGADITPFKHMIDGMFDSERFFASPIDYGCMCVCLDPISPAPIIKSQFDDTHAKDYLLASASCFPAFPIQVIDGVRYIDGGYHDNVPISLARSLGAEEIVAIDLKFKDERITIDEQTTYISPYVPLGSFLDFTSTTVHRNMRLGYLDTLKQYKQYYGYIYTFITLDLPKIEAFEEAYRQSMNMTTNTSSKLRLIKQFVNRSITKALNEYPTYEYPYLRVLEDCAQIFNMDDERIYDFQDFVTTLMKYFDEIVQTADQRLSAKKKVRDLAKEMKDYRKPDIIYYLYHRLVSAKQQDSDDLSYLSVIFKKEYVAAFTIYVLKNHLN